MTRLELPIISFLAVVLVLLPLPWHLRARNVATLSLIAWLVVCNLIRGIDAIIWMNNVTMRLPVWCDITTKILIGVTIALPACSFCITRHLEHVASARYAVATQADKRRRQKIDICFTLGLPVLIMALHYIVQGHRFDLLEDIGCQPATYIGLQAVLILWVPPVVLSLGALVYAALSLRHFAIRRMEFEQHLKDSNSALTTGRYMRLMALALSEMLWGTPLGVYVLYLNVRDGGLRPWISWYNVHVHFSRVVVYPSYLTPKWFEDRLLLTWWILPSTAILFFCFFGFSDEAIDGYVTAFRWILRNVFRQTIAPNSSLSRGSTSPPRFRRPAHVVSMSTYPNHLSLDVRDDKWSPSSVELSAFRGKDAEAASVLSLSYPGLGPDVEADAAATEGDYEQTSASSGSPVTHLVLASRRTGTDMTQAVRVVVEQETV